MASPVVLRSNSNNIVTSSPNTSSSLRRSSTIVSNSHLDANDLITISSSHHHNHHQHHQYMNGHSNNNSNGVTKHTNDKIPSNANYNNINSEIYLNSSKDVSILSLNGDTLPYSNTLHSLNDSFYLHKSSHDKADTSIRSDNIDDLEDGNESATLARITSGSSSSSNHSNHSMMSNIDSIETTITKRQSILVRQNSSRPKKRVSFNENLLEVHLIPTKSIEIDSYEEFNNYERSYTSTADTRYTTSYTNPPLLATKKLLNSKFYKPIRTLKTIESNAQITSDLRKNSRQMRGATSYGSLSRSNSIANGGNSRVPSSDVGTNNDNGNTNGSNNNLYKLSIKSIEFSNPINQLTTSSTHKTAITIEQLTSRKNNSANNEHNHLYAPSATTNGSGSQIYNHGFVPNSLFSRFINHSSSSQANNDTESISSNNSSNYVSTSSIKENISTDAVVPQIKYVPNMKKLRKTLNGTEIKEVWKEINKEKQQRDYENSINNNNSFSNNAQDESSFNQSIISNSYDGESSMLNNSLLINTSSNYDYDKNKTTTKYEIKPNNSLYSSLNRSPSIVSTTTANSYENTIPKSSTKSIYMNKINQLIALRNANVLNTNSTTTTTIRKSSQDNTTNPSHAPQQSTIKSRINTNTIPLSSSDLRRTHSALPILLRSSNNRINGYNTTKLLNSNPTISTSSPRSTPHSSSSTHVQHFSSIKRSPAVRYTQSKVS